MISNHSNEAFANVCLQSIQQAKPPPIPEDVVDVLPPRRSWFSKSAFTLFRQLNDHPVPLAPILNLVQSVLSFFSKGGLFMWPLLICSMFAVTTIILRGFALRERNVLPLVIESEIERLVPGGSAERLARIVHHDNSSLGADRARGVATSALAALGKYRVRANARATRNGCGSSAG